MLSSFESNDLQLLLGTFGQNIRGRKSKLKYRAIDLLRTRPAYINYQAYTAKIKIYEIYRSLEHGMHHNDIMMHSSLQHHQQQTQPRQMISSMGHIQNRLQRMYQPPQYSRQSMHMVRAGLPQLTPKMERGTIQYPPQRMYLPPQYPRQTMHMVRAGLPQVMPEMQRGTYGNRISNSIPANNMVNNNIQYLATGNNQSSESRTIVSHQLAQIQQMSVVAQDVYLFIYFYLFRMAGIQINTVKATIYIEYESKHEYKIKIK